MMIEKPMSSQQTINHPRLRTAVVATLIFAAASSASDAATVAYSQGTLTFDESRRVTVGAGGDFATCDKAVASFPNGSGGIIEFLPGSHVTACGNLGPKGNILITGRLGANGERPRITTPRNAKGVAMPFLTINPGTGAPAYDFVIENLDIYDTGAAINAWNHRGLVIRNVKIDDTNGADAVKVYPGDQAGTWLEIYGGEVSRGGSSNAKHNFYLGRLDRVLVDGLYSHSALGSHTFKAISRDITIRNSTFATTNLSYNAALNDPYLATTLVDFSACSTSLIEGNQFIGLKLQPSDRPNFPSASAMGTTTASYIDLKRRKSKMGGCDDPDYNDAFSYDWDAAAAGGYDPANPALLHHVIRNNTFVNIGQRDLPIVRNVGTAYLEDDGRSFTQPIGLDLPLPKGWFERSVAWLNGNTTHGSILPGEEWTPHVDYPYGAPIFVNGIRLGPTVGNPFVPVQVGVAPGTVPPPQSPKPTPPIVKPPPVVAKPVVPSLPTNPIAKPDSFTGTTTPAAIAVDDEVGDLSKQSATLGKGKDIGKAAPGFGSRSLGKQSPVPQQPGGFLGPVADALGKVAAAFSTGAGSPLGLGSSTSACSGGKCVSTDSDKSGR